MSKVLCFGDVHFSSINAWNYKAGEYFIDWFEHENFGNKDDIEMIFVGDIAERDVNPGNVVDQMWRLFASASSKAKAVYVVCGNHDKKLYHDIEQHSLKFLTNLPNVHVFEKETELVTENGYNVLVLPGKQSLPKVLHFTIITISCQKIIKTKLMISLLGTGTLRKQLVRLGHKMV